LLVKYSFNVIIESVELRTPIINGEVSEWFKEPVLKTGDPATGHGFESHPLRHYVSNPNTPRFIFVNGLFGIICER
jgi:hypothetical protein